MSENVRDTWATPPDFRAAVTSTYGAPALDVCADAKNRFAAQYFALDHFLPASRNGLTNCWQADTYAWCNPPGSEVAKWVAKAKEQQSIGNRSLLLVQCGLESDWFDSVKDIVETRILRPRVQFVPPPGIPKSSNARNYCLLDFDPKYLSNPMQRISVWQWKERA
jgi:phage N-6-adenine-methyltransferase